MADQRIEINPDILAGKPVVRGSRITVESILRKLAAGTTPEEIVGGYPGLIVEDIHAAQAFAARAVGRGVRLEIV